MKMCADHWAQIRLAIAARGLSHLGAKTGAEAHAAMASQLDGEIQKIEDFDPYASALWQITSRAVDVGGIYMLGLKPDGDGHYCPLCELDAHKEDLPEIPAGFTRWSDNWIEGCCNGILQYCREIGLAPIPS